MKLTGTLKHLIKIIPEFEKWIFYVAKSCEIDTSSYGFKTWEDLKNVTKTEEVFNNKDVKKFINAVIEKNPPAIQTLRFWLNKAVEGNSHP